MTRYLAIVARQAQFSDTIGRLRRQNGDAKTGFRVAFDGPRLFVLVASSAEALVSPDGEAVLLGSAFEQQAGGRSRRLMGPAALALPLKAHDRWGHYVALESGPGRRPVRIRRSPFGSLPCLYVESGRDLLVASDLAMLTLGGWASQGVAWDEVARDLAVRDLTRSRTCLVGVSELRGGDCLEADESRVRVTNVWSPWDAVGADRRPADRAAATGRIREAVTDAVCASTAASERPLLMLSGGLDSSIVAACLARAGKNFTCINLVSREASGDERGYARQVAATFGAPMTEAYRQARHVDLTVSAAAHLPRPSARGFVQDSSRLILETARAAGCDLVVDGGGGDNVFCSLQSVAPIADALRAFASGGEIWTAALSMAQLAESSVATVLTRAVRRAWRRSPAYRWPRDTGFLNRELLDCANAWVDHPWLATPSHACPGTAAHIALVIAAQSWIESFDPQAELPGCSPLVAQPVVEACVSAPSWWWFEDGCNRALARRAFADLLPPAIARRRSKASPDSFVAELFERNQATIRAMLLEGELAGRQLIDRAALEAVLAKPAPAQGAAYRPIMRLVDVEAWVRCWTRSTGVAGG